MRRREFIAGLGSAAAWPVVARAQQPAMPVIGFLTSNRSAAVPHYTAAFREGLAETGFVEGRNVKIEYRFAEQHLERIPALAVDLVRRGVAVIFSSGGDVPAMVAKGATSTIPIVFVSGYDPVKIGLVASLNRPGGNITGATVIAGELGPKRVELLRDLVPQVRAAGLMINPNEPNAESDIASAQAAAQSIGLQIHILNADSEQDVEKIFTTLVDLRADGLLVYPSPLFQNLRQKIVAMVARQRVPAVYYSRDYPAVGGLISYGASLTGLYRQGGIYVGRVLKGERPANLPVVQPTKFELVINLGTAKALGLPIPPAVLVRADEVTE
jgi:putative tryptophan/tyrosine transport system substrate-binding protein